MKTLIKILEILGLTEAKSIGAYAAGLFFVIAGYMTEEPLATLFGYIFIALCVIFSLGYHFFNKD